MFTKNFHQLNKNDASIAGGKGASLGEMTNAGIPIPPGFVLLSDAFEKFLEETDLNVEIDAIFKKIDHKKIHTAENASEKIQALILQAKMSEDIEKEIKKEFQKLKTKFVAVRSSATAEDSSEAAWAGQLESYLNTTEKNLLENVKKCWASLFTPRAIFYRIEKKLHNQKISVAVVIQKMIESEVSGIAFSVHPVTQDYNQIIIEAGFGLGEAIVSGSITPDSYVISKKPEKIIDINISKQIRGLFRKKEGGNEWKDISNKVGGKQKLTDKQIIELSKLIIKIENHYNFPQDIEWAMEKGKFYIVQSRPITTLNILEKGKVGEVEKPDLEEIKKLSWKHWIERPYGPFITSLTFKGVDGTYFSKFGLKGFGYFSNLYQYPDLYQSEKLSRKNKKLLEKYFKKHSIVDLSKNLDKVHKKNVKEIKALLRKNISPIKKLTAAREMLCLYFPALWIVEPLESYYQEKIAKLVPEYIKGDVQKWVGDVSIPKKKNAYVLMMDALRNKPIDEVRKEFAWLKSRDGFTDFYTAEELREIKSQINVVKPHKIKIPKELKNLSEELKELTFFRTDRTDKYYELLGLARPIFEDVAKQIGVHFKELAFYDAESIMKNNPRKIFVPFSYLYYSGKQWIDKNKFIEFEKDSKEDIIGMSAFSGTAIGIVKIIKHSSELDKFKKGNILVAQMTLPSFISAMHKAVAFVTDEGGITCHAAIIAREMKKPCIIGTKIATKVLNDGDLVEVNADKGIVKIIKRNKILS